MICFITVPYITGTKRYIASYRTHRMEVIWLLCMFLKIIKKSLND